MTVQKIRNVRPQWDAERIIDLFRKSQVPRGYYNAKRGFFDYSLPDQIMLDRIAACPELSLVLENNRGELLAYLLAYTAKDIAVHGLNQEYPDPVLQKLRGANPKVVYVDQLCASPQVPAFVAGRLVDVWTSILYGERFEGERLTGSVCAIPSKPWDNVASRRLAITRGYSRVGQVTDRKVSLDIFAKPNLKKDSVFDPREDFIGTEF